MPAKTFIVQKPQNKKYWDQNYVVFINCLFIYSFVYLFTYLFIYLLFYSPP